MTNAGRSGWRWKRSPTYMGSSLEPMLGRCKEAAHRCRPSEATVQHGRNAPVARACRHAYTRRMLRDAATAVDAEEPRLGGGPRVRHLRQILLWPLRLLPAEEGGAPHRAPWHHLRELGERSPW